MLLLAALPVLSFAQGPRQASPSAGTIRVVASADGLPDAELEISVR